MQDREYIQVLKRELAHKEAYIQQLHDERQLLTTNATAKEGEVIESLKRQIAATNEKIAMLLTANEQL